MIHRDQRMLLHTGNLEWLQRGSDTLLSASTGFLPCLLENRVSTVLAARDGQFD